MADPFTIIAAVSSVAGVASGVKAAKEQKRGVEIQRQQAQAQANRQRRQAIRQNLIARSQLENQATAAGVSGGSGFAGGLSSATSQFGANLGYSGTQQGLQNRLFQAQSAQASATGLSQTFGAIGSLGFKLAQSPSAVNAANNFLGLEN